MRPLSKLSGVLATSLRSDPLKRIRILWQIYFPMVIVIVASVAGSAWFAADHLHDFSIEQTKTELLTRALLVKRQIHPLFTSQSYGLLNEICRQINNETSTRITVMLASGKVVADSMQDPAKMDNHAYRSEIIDALDGGTGSSIRHSQTVRKEMLYVAVALFATPTDNGKSLPIDGILRLSIPITTVNTILSKVIAQIVMSAFILILIAAVITLAISRNITKPLEKMRNYAENLSCGKLESSLDLAGNVVSRELTDLASTMTLTADQLNDRLNTVVKQRNELEAVFSSMIESVVVVDKLEKIISLNKSAANLFDLSELDVKGKAIHHVFPGSELVCFIKQTLKEKSTREEEILVHKGKDDLFLQAHGTILPDSDNNNVGVLVVLNDITRIRKLEEMRKDFVANVSHELRTPITAIKGFIETLQDGALSHPQDARRFLLIIEKHTNRLSAIIEDLLTLSRVEKEQEKKKIILEIGLLSEPLKNTIETCMIKAQEKDITLNLQCIDDLKALINAPLLEQAVSNLIINAIQYSDEGSRVSIIAALHSDEIIVQVIDQGVGIAKEHLSRIFERFYRLDKARSRTQGGTGLGLAIVKHITEAHGGRVSVDSTYGAGSTFASHLPAA